MYTNIKTTKIQQIKTKTLYIYALLFLIMYTNQKYKKYKKLCIF